MIPLYFICRKKKRNWKGKEKEIRKIKRNLIQDPKRRRKRKNVHQQGKKGIMFKQINMPYCSYM